MTVWAHFNRKFPHAAIDREDANVLRGMVLDSSCGDDCRAAIDAGALLRGKVRMAHGNASNAEIELGRIVADVCCVYIAG